MHDELDKLIDGALATYSAAEPLAGLEQRVLDRVRLAEAAHRRRRRWTFVLAAPAVAATLFVILAPKPKPEPEPVPVALVQPPPATAVPAVVARPTPRPRRPAPKHEMPKRNIFPTISPLTGEERLLVQLAQSNPQLLAVKPVDEIEIKPIEIAPLQIDGAQQGDTKQ